MEWAYRYRPRDYMVNPKSFGRHMEAKWKDYRDLDPETQLKVSTAFLQHEAARQTLSFAAKLG